MSKKRKYRAKDISKINIKQLNKKTAGKSIILGTDAAKELFYASIMDQANEEVLQIIKFEHPAQTEQCIALLQSLECKKLQVAIEPTGTYGDIFRQMCWDAGIEVFLVHPLHVERMAEPYDGVPSLHDPKSAGIIAKLHRDRRSRLWTMQEDFDKKLNIAVKRLNLTQNALQRLYGQLEALLARHWPELTQYLKLTSRTLLELLAQFGTPHEIAKHSALAQELMKKASRNKLDEQKIQQIVESAKNSLGIVAIREELEFIKEIAQEAKTLRKKKKENQKELSELCKGDEELEYLAPVIGTQASVGLVSKVGRAQDYKSPAAYLKATGLNLKVRSSGKYKGKLKITKRGPSEVRVLLSFAVGRLLQSQPIIKAWYDKKVKRDGNIKGKAFTAVMRKVVKALWYVGRGARFDASKLFDVTKLELG